MGRDVGCVPRHFIHRLEFSPATEHLCVLFQLKGKYVTVKYLVVMLPNPTQMFRSSPHAFRGFFSFFHVDLCLGTFFQGFKLFT
jgi:hypothetical protein